MPTGSRDLRSHRAPILNYFRAKKQLSSGVVEGLRSEQHGQPTMRKSYGFHTFHVTEIAKGQIHDGLHPAQDLAFTVDSAAAWPVLVVET